MPQVLSTILYILLFIVCLSFLIVIHELGHFTAAKIFKVYVMEYSIGFGPALIHKKRKTGETYFSLRIIPFGGYVSMYGEGVELPEGQVIDESRSLEKAKAWKRAIILAAGVTLNVVLALHLFFIKNVACSDQQLYLRNMSVTEGSKADAAGLKTLDVIALNDEIDANTEEWFSKENTTYYLLDNAATAKFTDEPDQTVYAFVDTKDVKNFKDIQMNRFIVLFASKEATADNKLKVDFGKQISYNEKFVSVTIDFKTVTKWDEKKEKGVEFASHPIEVERTSEGKLEDFGYSMYLQVNRPLPFFKAIGQSFVDFGESSTLIFRAIGTLFTKETWNSLGGIVAIGFESTSVLQNLGIGKYIYLWGALSVNLAIINLLPFPGLDGYQLVVLAVESITKKKIPNKVKTIVSIVGLGLLFTFMIVLVVKDLITYVF